MIYRPVTRVVDGVELAEGAGARVVRSIGIPALPSLDPFVLLDEAFVQPPAAFPMHEHRGFEIITYLYSGALEHVDSAGNRAVVRAGGAQKTVAGHGIRHSESPVGAGLTHGLQLWVNLPRSEKQAEPSYQDVDAAAIPETRRDGVIIRTIIGENTPIQLHTPIRYWDVHLLPGGAFREQIPADFAVAFYVVEGRGWFGPNQVVGRPRQLLIGGPGEGLLVTSDEEVHFVCLAGKPLGEAIKRIDGTVE